MHLILLTRGINQEVEIWKTFMQSQMFWWKRQPLVKDEKGQYIPDGTNEDGTVKYKRGAEQTTRVQGVLRPIQLWEYVIPEECLPELLAAMNLQNTGKLRPEVNKVAWMLRKGMGAKPVPQFPEIVGKTTEQLTSRFIPHNAVATYPIGVKYDKKQDFIFNKGKPYEEGWYQEGL